MPEPFSIPRVDYSDASLHAMQGAIQARTLNAAATESILRSIERFGCDESIRYFEMIPQTSARTRHGKADAAWTVRAVR